MTALSGLVTPYDGDEFYAVTTLAVRHHQGLHDQSHTIAVDLRKLLANPTGTKMAAARVDLKMNAWRVARHLEHAAAADLAIAKSWTAAYRTYRELYTQGAKPSEGRQFQVT